MIVIGIKTLEEQSEHLGCTISQDQQRSPSDVLTPNEQHSMVMSNKWLTTELQ